MRASNAAKNRRHMRGSLPLKTADGLPAVIACLGAFGIQVGVAQADPLPIPLQHVKTDSDQDEYNRLGIMVGVDGAAPQLFELDTGSDEFNFELGLDVSDLEPVLESEPEMYAYGDGTYGSWVRKVRFDSLSYYDPDAPTEPVATLDGGYMAGQILDRVYTADLDGFQDLNVTRDSVGDYDGQPVYADLDVRQSMEAGEPGREPPFYGIFSAGDFLSTALETSALGGRTESGYIIAANANLDEAVTRTPGCAPCLLLHLTPSLRAQFTALMPWGDLAYSEDDREFFPQSGANASLEFEGNYSFTIGFDANGRQGSADFEGPILFDTGSPDFLFASQAEVVSGLEEAGLALAENSDNTVDFFIYGFESSLDNLSFEDIVVSRLTNEDEGGGITVGLPFFQSNSVMYDLENRTTAYSPFFVSAEDFTTDVPAAGEMQLNRITGDMGSQGWVGLAGVISGENGLMLDDGAVVRISGANSYRGTTQIASEAYLYLTGPGSIEASETVVVDGLLDISRKGNYWEQWGVADDENDAVIQSLSGTGVVRLGGRRLVLTAANDPFDGSITDYDEDFEENLGGGLLVAGGQQTLSGQNDYSGPTEVAEGASLHVPGSLAGDVFVSGQLIVDGEVSGTISVEKGGILAGSGTAGSVTLADGGSIAPESSLHPNQ